MQPRRPRKKRGGAKRARTPWVPIIIVGIGAIAVVVAIVLGSALLRGGSTPKATPGPTHAAPQKGATVGRDDAPVTMVEYYRFDCPHCEDFALQVGPRLEQEYVDTGKLRIEFRPLATDGDVLQASEAAACAGDQGRYWEYYDLVFANSARGFGEGNLKEYARDLGLDTGAFDACLDDGKHKEEIVNATQKAFQAGVTSWPRFFIGKTSEMDPSKVTYPSQTQLDGVDPANPYNPFKTAVEDVLKKAQ